MRVIRRIDRGGFGFVDEIETSSGGHIARKSFDPPSQDAAELANLRRRFEREVRIQSALKHPNIMPIYDVHLTGDPPSFTMPLATMSLDAKLAEDHRTSGFAGFRAPQDQSLSRYTCGRHHGGTTGKGTYYVLNRKGLMNSSDCKGLTKGSNGSSLGMRAMTHEPPSKRLNVTDPKSMEPQRGQRGHRRLRGRIISGRRDS
jgi:serine/threonine protein kinase